MSAVSVRTFRCALHMSSSRQESSFHVICFFFFLGHCPTTMGLVNRTAFGITIRWPSEGGSFSGAEHQTQKLADLLPRAEQIPWPFFVLVWVTFSSVFRALLPARIRLVEVLHRIPPESSVSILLRPQFEGIPRIVVNTGMNAYVWSRCIR